MRQFCENQDRQTMDSQALQCALANSAEQATRHLISTIRARQDVVLALQDLCRHNDCSHVLQNTLADNLWLLDGQFASFVHAPSPAAAERYTQALDALGVVEDLFQAPCPRPTLFFSDREDRHKDALTVWFADASPYSLAASCAINTMARAVRETQENVHRIWVYVIANFHAPLRSDLLAQDFKPVLAEGHGNICECVCFCRFFVRLDASCTCISPQALLARASAQNSAFLEACGG